MRAAILVLLSLLAAVGTAADHPHLHISSWQRQKESDSTVSESFRLSVRMDKACQLIADDHYFDPAAAGTPVVLTLPVGVHIIRASCRHYYSDTLIVTCAMAGMEASGEWQVSMSDTFSGITAEDIKAGPHLQVQNVAGYPYHFSATSNDVYEWADVMPEYTGGEKAFVDALHHVSYIDSAADVIRGKVMVSFVVEKDGSVSDIQVQPRELDRYSNIKAILAPMRFRPGRIVDAVVRVRLKVPVFICLRSGE